MTIKVVLTNGTEKLMFEVKKIEKVRKFSLTFDRELVYFEVVTGKFHFTFNETEISDLQIVDWSN